MNPEILEDSNSRFHESQINYGILDFPSHYSSSEKVEDIVSIPVIEASDLSLHRPDSCLIIPPEMEELEMTYLENYADEPTYLELDWTELFSSTSLWKSPQLEDVKNEDFNKPKEEGYSSHIQRDSEMVIELNVTEAEILDSSLQYPSTIPILEEPTAQQSFLFASSSRLRRSKSFQIKSRNNIRTAVEAPLELYPPAHKKTQNLSPRKTLIKILFPYESLFLEKTETLEISKISKPTSSTRKRSKSLPKPQKMESRNMQNSLKSLETTQDTNPSLTYNGSRGRVELRGVSHPRAQDIGGIYNPPVGGMSSRGKSGPNAKKVSPPTIPDGGSSASSTCSSHRHSGSSLSSGVYSATSDQRASFCSNGEDSMPPPSPSRDATSDLGSMTESTVSSSSLASSASRVVNSNGTTASPSHYQNNQFTFPSSHQVPQFAHLMCPKASPGSPHHGPSDPTYGYIPFQHRQSLEDQGIDVQSPGRSSPGSGSGSSTSGSTGSSSNCRNSTTSLDSGRASNSTLTHTHRLSGTSYDSNFMRHSYHSSSSSLGSMEIESNAHISVHELMKNGVPDHEILRVWLGELHFEEYHDNFASAGYDLPTITRMTPEDLNAIGITKPSHRKRIKSEINRLAISDGLPDYIPARLDDWLSLLKLSEYASSLKQQNYNSVHHFTQITWEDLEDVGITKLGHQKKVMLAIKRAKDIMSGKNFRNSPDSGKSLPNPQYHTQDVHIHREKDTNNLPNMAAMNSFGHPGLYSQGNQPDPGGKNLRNGQLQHVHPSQIPFKYPGAFASTDKNSNPMLHYRPDVVAVQVRPTPNRSANDEPIYSTFFPDQRPGVRALGPLTRQSVIPNRSLDDGDITPTNDPPAFEGGGTLPRPHRLAAKQRPVAKVTAKTRVDIHEAPKAEPKSAPVLMSSAPQTPKGTPKKMPPPPPKRSNSISEHSKPTQNARPTYPFLNRGLSSGYIQTSLQPEVVPNMPPPPPAPQDKGNHQLLPDDFPPPPPPLTCLTLASATQNTAHSNPSISSDLQFTAKRNETKVAMTETGESLPFANDNAGTIKQRVARGPFTLSRSSPRSSPLSSPALRRKEGVVLPIVRQPVYAPSTIEVPTKDTNDAGPTSDVLNDIGNMLTNLTNELDAMIDQDRSLKN